MIDYDEVPGWPSTRNSMATENTMDDRRVPRGDRYSFHELPDGTIEGPNVVVVGASKPGPDLISELRKLERRLDIVRSALTGAHYAISGFPNEVPATSGRVELKGAREKTPTFFIGALAAIVTDMTRQIDEIEQITEQVRSTF